MKPKTYSQAGVDTRLAGELKGAIAGLAAGTLGTGVVAGPGPFAGLYQLQGYREPLLVASADGVGTKLKLAAAEGRYHGLGQDLVHHCTNDILTSGARPLFLLDYIAADRLRPEVIEDIVRGIADACRGVGCALLGGETAEMPGVYQEGEHDLMGFIVGAVEKERVIEGRDISPGDSVLALPSSGLHTNGYSLARSVFNLDASPSAMDRFHSELGRTLGEALLEPHRCYLRELEPWLPHIKGMAHITGGGLGGNLPRCLPSGVGVRISRDNWQVPPLFRLIQETGPVADVEMWRTFNMGVGIAIVLSPRQANRVKSALPTAFLIGEVVEGERQVIIQ
ncbi:MAG: phosphoribosylformylglycinamidine cyclo-ligase [Dehalococcoidia bacterium]|jgi:phosphoribosylformylglycinamidine cyclo-ligase|nr:phosphoribosylformylglycinamidine cyclo-ligase [Dehalococcoidia bacterium]